MKYRNRLFAFEDRPSQQESSATLTATLYSVTFVPDSTSSQSVVLCPSVASVAFRHNKIGIAANGPKRASTSNCHRPSKISADRLGTRPSDRHSLESDARKSSERTHAKTSISTARSISRAASKPGESSSHWIADTLARTIAITFASKTDDNQRTTTASDAVNIGQIDDDWILVERLPSEQSLTTTTTTRATALTTTATTPTSERKLSDDSKKVILTHLQQMALDKSDLELIKASWIPVRKDPVASGVLLFRGLFTKFPQYLKHFPQFSDLDIEHMKENKRLLRHAVKVIETVTFVVDAIGDDEKAAQLNEALVGLVKSHLRKKIGLAEFRNLGIVLIDFICDFNNRRGCPVADKQLQQQQHRLSKSSTVDSSNHSSADSDTMTNALDKIRSSTSPSSSSEDESYLRGRSSSTAEHLGSADDGLAQNIYRSVEDEATGAGGGGGAGVGDVEVDEDLVLEATSSRKLEAKIDTNALVAGWTKLYGSILDLVQREEGQAD